MCLIFIDAQIEPNINKFHVLNKSHNSEEDTVLMETYKSHIIFWSFNL